MNLAEKAMLNLFPEKIREAISIIINLLMVTINGYIFYLSILIIRSNTLKRTPVLEMPSMYINMAITVGFGLITIHAVQFLITEVRLFLGPSKNTNKTSIED